MKKPVLVFGMLVAGGLAFTSCNKNLKDDIKDLKSKVDTLNKHNSELQEQIDNIEVIFGANEPITATTTFTDNNNATKTIKESYYFKSTASQTQRMEQDENGNYLIYIERFKDVWSGDGGGAWVAFTYNPTSKAITDKRGGHYWWDTDVYENRARYSELDEENGLTINITIDKISTTTGEISLKFSATGNETYTDNIGDNAPNPGKPMSTNFNFTGKLVVFPYED